MDTELIINDDLFKVEKRRKWSANLPSQRLMLKALDMKD
jgi:hypothetical protein